MADGFDVALNGVEELNAKIKGISDDLRLKGGRFALLKAGQIVRDAAINNAWNRDDTATEEAIAKNIVIRWGSKRFKSTGDLSFRIGVLGGSRKPDTRKKERRRARDGSKSLEELGDVAGKGKGNPGGDTFYWRFLEFGTKDHAAKPFMRQALEKNTQKATDVFITEYGKAIDRAIKKAAKGK